MVAKPKNDYGVWTAGVTDYKVFRIYKDTDDNMRLDLVASFEDYETAQKFCDTWRGAKELPDA